MEKSNRLSPWSLESFQRRHLTIAHEVCNLSVSFSAQTRSNLAARFLGRLLITTRRRGPEGAPVFRAAFPARVSVDLFNILGQVSEKVSVLSSGRRLCFLGSCSTAEVSRCWRWHWHNERRLCDSKKTVLMSLDETSVSFAPELNSGFGGVEVLPPCRSLGQEARRHDKLDLCSRYVRRRVRAEATASLHYW